MTTTEPTAVPEVVPKVEIDVCESCGATYGPSFDDVIYRAWLEAHARPHTGWVVPDAPS